ncbi:NADH-quinone oxidoreductase subunit J [Oryzomicrobium sp.]|uniref:NADH-quinone oxidoreductase subunit J n=1 Tax=Oryzomicrobium sp. TaxID=1911578 RepID=UPI0025D3F0FF|nr:NADH-quinone oxidoreductase subunit J [Oryzomicrobium sp.]MCE1244618.1 NADH-quinone oxidoreductase subunit J [Oryzomicrobium sp.]
MEFKTFVFYLFSTILVLASLRVITARNPVHAALFLVLAFFTASGIWMLLQAEFLAISLVLVYVGAVMVLFLFVVMMLDVNLEKLKKGFWSYLPLGALVGLLMMAEMGVVLGGQYMGVMDAPLPQGVAAVSNTKELGRVIYTDYVYPFELAAVILLLAIVAAIALTHRGLKKTKYADPAKQVRVKASDRLRVLQMPAEKAE